MIAVADGQNVLVCLRLLTVDIFCVVTMTTTPSESDKLVI